MDEGDYKWLEDGFDPSKVTIPQLRGILSSCDVDIPVPGRKSDLVRTFNEDIAPRRTELRKRFLGIVPNSKNISDASPKGSPKVSNSPFSTPRKQKAKTVKEVTPELDDEEAVVTPLKPRTRPATPKTKSPKSAIAIADAADVAVADVASPISKKALRKEKKEAKKETKKGSLKEEPKEEDVFSSENVFQSGRKRSNHSLPEPSRKSKRRERSSDDQKDTEMGDADDFNMSSDDGTNVEIMEVEIDVDVSGSGSGSGSDSEAAANMSELAQIVEAQTERIEDWAEEIADELSRETVAGQSGFMPSLNSLTSAAVENSIDDSDAPEQPLADIPARIVVKEVEVEVEEEPEEEISPAQNAHSRSIALQGLKFAALASAVGSLGFLGNWYRTERLNAGFCDQRIIPYTPNNPLNGYTSENPQLASLFEAVSSGFDRIAPECIPCPEHATCVSTSEYVCDNGYVPAHSLYEGLGIGNPKCVIDYERSRKVRELVDQSLRILRKHAANVLCNFKAPVAASEVKPAEAAAPEAIEVPDTPEILDADIFSTEEAVFAQHPVVQVPPPVQAAVQAEIDEIQDLLTPRGMPTSAGLTEAELLEQLRAQKPDSVTEEEFVEMWEEARKQILSNEEIEMVITQRASSLHSAHEIRDGTNAELVQAAAKPEAALFVSHSRRHMSLPCRLRLDASYWVDAKKAAIAATWNVILAKITPSKRTMVLASLSSGSAGMLYFLVKRSLLRRRRLHVATQELLGAIRAQQLKADTDISGCTERYCVVYQLLEHVPQDLRSELKEKVESDKRIRARQIEIRGEILRIWEWGVC